MIVAIYARKSNEQNGVADEARSVVRQVENGRAYAERKGWPVLDEHIYADDGVAAPSSASNARASPACSRRCSRERPSGWWG
jgi:hypothetical protein